MKLVFIGPPGAGKGTIAKKVAENFDIAHISTGDIIRDQIKKETPLGLEIKNTLSKGDLISDNLMIKLAEETLKDEILTHTGYILDGFPRTYTQTEWIMNKYSIDHYIIFDIITKDVIERLSGRRIHAASGRIYHITHSPPKITGKDDVSGEPLIQREDDVPEKIKNRLEVYQKQTYPIINYIETHTINYTHIDASKSESLVAAEVFDILSKVK